MGGTRLQLPHLPKQGESLANIQPEGNKLASVASVHPHDLLIYFTYLKYVSSSGASGSTPNHYLHLMEIRDSLFKDARSEGWSLGVLRRRGPMVLQTGNWGPDNELTVSPWGKFPFHVMP